MQTHVLTKLCVVSLVTALLLCFNTVESAAQDNCDTLSLTISSGDWVVKRLKDSTKAHNRSVRKAMRQHRAEARKLKRILKRLDRQNDSCEIMSMEVVIDTIRVYTSYDPEEEVWDVRSAVGAHLEFVVCCDFSGATTEETSPGLSYQESPSSFMKSSPQEATDSYYRNPIVVHK